MLQLLLLLELLERRKYLVAMFEIERRKRLGRGVGGVGGVGACVVLLRPYSCAFKRRGRRHQLL